MKSASAGLIDLLNSSQQIYVADLIEIRIIATGNIYRYTSSDIDITDEATGHSYSSSGPLFKRSKISSKIGLETGELEVDISVNPDMEIESQPWMIAARIGVFDSATLRLSRAFMPSWGDTSLGLVELFSGHFADIEIDGSRITATIKNLIDVLDTQLPKNLYQAACIHSLFDEGCTLSRAALTQISAVETSFGTPTKSYVPVANGDAPAYWDQGIITFTSGANEGISRTIKTNPATHQIYITTPLPALPADGDTIELVPGCDKTLARCTNIFGNRDNYRGYPFIPIAETAQ